jgi:hypothetical protein
MLATPASDHLPDKPGVFPDGGDRGADLGVGAHFRHACATAVAGLALSAVAQPQPAQQLPELAIGHRDRLQGQRVGVEDGAGRDWYEKQRKSPTAGPPTG